MPEITVTTPYDTLTMTGTDIASGWIYDDAALASWYALAEVDARLTKRPNAHGVYSVDQLFTNEHRTEIPGKYFGASATDAVAARNRLTALFNDGKPVTVTVEEGGLTTSRVGTIIDVDPQWKPDHHFEFTLVFAAFDSRRYGDERTVSAGMPSPSSGLVWPLGSTDQANPAVYWNWGTPGATGRVSFTNGGNTPTYPVLLVGSGGELDGGFSIVEVSTGRTLTYSRDTGGSIVRLDNRTRRATINGSDVTGGLTRREWFEIPPGATYEYQIVALGGVTGAPTYDLSASDAYL